MVLSAVSLALLSLALRCPKGIPTTVLLVPATSQQIWDKDVTLVLAFCRGQAVPGRMGLL